MEEWKAVVGYEGYYEVSSYGRVRGVDRYVNTGILHSDIKLHKGKMLKPNLKKNGYLSVDLCKGNKLKTVLVHRLVAVAFIEKPDGKDVVNHKNLDKTDNRVENLEWVTCRENTLHASANGVIYGGLRKQVRCLETGMLFPSSYQAAQWLNETKFHYSKSIITVSRNIRGCCTGDKKSAYGYHWKDVIQ